MSDEPVGKLYYTLDEFWADLEIDMLKLKEEEEKELEKEEE